MPKPKQPPEAAPAHQVDEAAQRQPDTAEPQPAAAPPQPTAALRAHSAPAHATLLAQLSSDRAYRSGQALLLQLQRQYGNRYVRRVVALSRQQSAPQTAPHAVEQRIQQARGGGQALDNTVRRRMEQAFGADFSAVQVHTDAEADTLNRALSARAFATGRDIFFRQGAYQPGSSAGRELLAHELTHVVQQNGSQVQTKLTVGAPGDRFEQEAEQVARAVMQQEQQAASGAAPSRQADAPAQEHSRQVRPLQRQIEEEEPDELQGVEAFEADDLVMRDSSVAVQMSAPPSVQRQAADTSTTTAPLQPALSSLPGEQVQRQAKGEASKSKKVRFWIKFDKPLTGEEFIALTEQTIYGRPMPNMKWEGVKKQYTPADSPVSALVRAETLQGHLKDYGESVSKVISGLDQIADATTYQRLNKIIQKLTPMQWANYEKRVTAKARTLDEFEKSVNAYLAEQIAREATVRERRTIETRFYNLDALYDRYQLYLSMLKNSARLSGMGASNPRALGGGLGSQPTLNKMRAELDEDLIKAGFPGGITDFQKLIDDYEKAFERETLAIARVMLDQYAHLLWVEEQRYRKSAEGEALFEAVSQTKARADYEEAEKIRSEHASIPYTLEEQAEQSYWVGQRNAALARGEQKVRSAAGDHPLVGHRDFNRERLARASKREVAPMMLGYIAARKKDIAETRKNLADKPTMIYGLDTLLKASFQAQKIQSGSIFDKIIRNHMSDVKWTEAIPDIILAVVAIAAGLLTGGGGTVAVLAAGTALGIGAYQAIEEFKRYEVKSAAHGAQLTSDDPSMAWVIVAVIGAGIDAAAFVSVLPKLRPALEAFNAGAEAGDVARLEQKLTKLTEVKGDVPTPEVSEDMVKTILNAAKAEAEERAAWKAIFKPPAALRAVILPLAEEFGRFVYAVYRTWRRGIQELKQFVKTNEAIDLLGDVTKLAPEEMAALKNAYLKAIEEMETVAKHGNTLSMSEDEIRAFMNLRGNTKGMTVEQVMKEMDAWKVTRGSGVPFGFQSAEQFEKFQATASKELSRVLKRADPNAEAFLQGSAVTGVSYKRHLPFDVQSDFDIAISSRYLMKQAEKLGHEVKLNPRHIGPLGDDQIAELGLGKLQKRLGEVVVEEAKAAGATEAAAPRKINIMLFDTAEAVKKPLGQASKETERAAIPLKVKE